MIKANLNSTGDIAIHLKQVSLYLSKEEAKELLSVLLPLVGVNLQQQGNVGGKA